MNGPLSAYHNMWANHLGANHKLLIMIKTYVEEMFFRKLSHAVYMDICEFKLKLKLK